MKLFRVILVTAVGFLLGVVLAGVGGLPAKTLLFGDSSEKIEKYWLKTNLNPEHVAELISNEKCRSSEKYFKSCVSAVVQTLLNLGLRVELNSIQPQIIEDKLVLKFEELNERQLLDYHLENFPGATRWNFDKILHLAFTSDKNVLTQETAADFINSFLAVYVDPHSYLIPRDYYVEVGSKIDRSKYFVGLTYQKRQGYFKVTEVSKNSDAERAGLQAGDIILSINSQNLIGVSYRTMGQILRNESTAEFKFKFLRAGHQRETDFKRSYRTISHVQYEYTSPDNQIGLITFSRFSKSSCYEIKQAFLGFNKTQTKTVILDLRGNPGGQLDEAVCIAGLLMGQDKSAYYVEYAEDNKPAELVLTDHPKVYEGELVVLINHNSASASELLAGALKDYKRGVLIGRRTFGKGTFQEPEEWTSESQVSFFKTRGYYLLPSQISTQLVGVTPDISLVNRDQEEREADVFINPMPIKANAEIKIPAVANGSLSVSLKNSCVAQLTAHKKQYSNELHAAVDFIKCTNSEKSPFIKTHLAIKNKKEN